MESHRISSASTLKHQDLVAYVLVVCRLHSRRCCKELLKL